MNRRQRRTVNFFQRYVIDDQAVEKSKVAEAKAKAETVSCDWTKAVSGEVTDELRLESADLKELHSELNFENKSDRHLFYEVTGILFDGDDFRSDGDPDSDSDDSDSCISSSPNSDGKGNNSLLIASPSSANALSHKKERTSSSKYKKKKVMADIQGYD